MPGSTATGQQNRQCIPLSLPPVSSSSPHPQDLVKGVNEEAQAVGEEDSFTATLEEQASTSESKLNALLEEVILLTIVCLVTEDLQINACHTVLRFAVLCYAMLCYAMLCYAMLSCCDMYAAL